jgi:hypothetical protein
MDDLAHNPENVESIANTVNEALLRGHNGRRHAGECLYRARAVMQISWH